MQPVSKKKSSLEVHSVANQNIRPCQSMISYFSLHPFRSCLICYLLLFHILLLSFLPHFRPFFVGLSNTVTLLKSDHNCDDHKCEYGKFYVYDLPKEFNTEIVERCDLLSNPVLGPRCGTYANNGFGPLAPGIDQIIPANFSKSWYWTDQFALDILFHNRLLNHKCRTLDAESAKAYYIPFYIGIEGERYLWSKATHQEKDRLCLKMLSWLQDNYPYMSKSKSLNHFMSVGRVSTDYRRDNDRGRSGGWGSKCLLQPSMRNVTRLLIERLVTDEFDVGVPYPTLFHPSTALEVVSWQNFVLSHPRHSLMSYTGGPRRGLDIRGVLGSQCDSAGKDVCHIVDCSGRKCSNGTNAVLEAFLDSDFCLQPVGDTYTRRSTFECLIAGSIPVFFWNESAYLNYQWYLPDEPKSYSVFVDHDEVVRKGKSVKEVLEKISKEEVKRMRETVVEIIPKLIYPKSNEGLGSMQDAVDVAVDGVLRRISKIQGNDK